MKINEYAFLNRLLIDLIGKMMAYSAMLFKTLLSIRNKIIDHNLYVHACSKSKQEIS